MTILVLGAGGQVGRALAERAGSAALAYDRAGCDITDAASVARATRAPALDAVVNCAAFTAVDRAESEAEQAFAVNAEGAANVARAAAERGIPVIHLSTDYVYAGTREGLHVEDDPIAPLNVYGASKATGDAAVAAANGRHLLLRVSWVFGAHGANFVKTMLRLGHDRSELRIVNDQVGGPTEAVDIADTILTMIAASRRPGFDAWGTYHFCGAPSVTWYEFARAIFEHAGGHSPALVPIASREYPTPAKRPQNSRLDCGKIAQTFGIAQPDWRRSLERVLRTLGEMAG